MSKRPKIVTVFGNSGAGKSTLAGFMAKLSGGKVINFADPVKLVGKHMVGIPLEVSHGTQEDKAAFLAYGKTAREHLRMIGTEFGRDKVSETVWVDRFLDAAVDAFSEGVPFISSGDGRFPAEEFIYLRDQARCKGVDVVGVVIRRPSVPIDRSHRSESVIADTPDSVFDHIVNNTQDIRMVYNHAVSILEASDIPIINRFDPMADQGCTVESHSDDRGDCYIRTYTGRKYWPLSPAPEDVDLKDIARGLANEIRWNGMTRVPINVAWHSNRVRSLALATAPSHIKIPCALYAQLHDAHEAYIKDIPKPLKELIDGYDGCEKANDVAIFTKFGLPQEMPEEIAKIVWECDSWMAGYEARRWHNLETNELPEKMPTWARLACLRYLEVDPSPEKDEADFIFFVEELLDIRARGNC